MVAVESNTLLASKDPEIRQNAARMLGLLGDERAVEPLIEALSSELHMIAAGAAAGALGRLRDPRSVPVLLKRLAVCDPDTVQTVVAGIVRMGDAGREELLKALRSDDKHTRRNAAHILARVGLPVADPLIGFLEGDDPGLKQLAAWALAQMSGEFFFGQDVEKWRKWLADKRRGGVN